MAEELVFYTNPMSRGRIARWMLEEVGAPYRTELIGYGAPMKSADYRAINPMGKVPALRHGEAVITECAAICAYLADAFPEAGLAPSPKDRANYYRWLFFAAGPLEAAIMDRQLGLETTPEQQRMAGYGSFDAAVETLEKAAGDWEYVAGGRFSAADVYVGSHIIWGLQFGTLPKRLAFESYAERLTARPAYQRASEMDDAAGKAMPHPSAE